MKQYILELEPHLQKAFDNFIVGNNELLLQVLHQLTPGQLIYLWGPKGIGKTHLLQAVAQYYQESYANMTTWHFERGQLLTIIDDVQEATDPQQQALFDLINDWQIHSTGEHSFSLLLAGDVPPVALQVREDLRNRLGWGVIFEIYPLTNTDLYTAFVQQAQDRGLVLSPQVIAWIETHCTRHAGQLMQLLNELDMYSLSTHREITIPLIKEYLMRTE